MKIVIDTSVFIDYSRAQKGLLPELAELSGKNQAKLFVPTSVILEFWAGKSLNKKSVLRKSEKLFSGIKRIELTEELAKLAGGLSRKYSTPAMDAIIAATALHLDAKLATQNAKHFKNIPKLKFFN